MGDLDVAFCDLGVDLVDLIVVVAGIGVQVDAFTAVLPIYQ